jgi:fructuronate reductase
VAVVSCDNLPSNGRLLGDVVRQGVACAGQPGALAWLAANVTFPATMVDRIVPASTPATLAAARDALGVADLAAVAAEPFRQWVIEDAFPAGRPAWELVGATLAADVEPWERMKLRVLNGLHSTLAYLGALAGVATIAEALELPGMRSFLARMVAEDIAPTLDAIDGQPAEGYAATVLERFSNAALGHRTLQVAMDGSQKLPQRLLGTVADRRRAGAEPCAAALALAAWMRFVRGYGDDGGSLPLDDPLAGRLREAVAGAPDTPQGLAGALFGCGEVFGAELAGDDRVRSLVVGWLGVLATGGVPAALAHAT